MQNFDNKLIKIETTLNNIRGYLLRKIKLKQTKEIEKDLLKENF